MKIKKLSFASLLLSALMMSCTNGEKKKETTEQKKDSSATTQTEIMADRFADIQVLRYDVPGFADLSLKQKQLAYYLYEAGLSLVAKLNNDAIFFFPDFNNVIYLFRFLFSPSAIPNS